MKNKDASTEAHPFLERQGGFVIAGIGRPTGGLTKGRDQGRDLVPMSPISLSRSPCRATCDVCSRYHLLGRQLIIGPCFGSNSMALLCTTLASRLARSSSSSRILVLVVDDCTALARLDTGSYGRCVFCGNRKRFHLQDFSCSFEIAAHFIDFFEAEGI